jgi:glucose-1-phosphate thymidylyltransferase
MKGLLLAGGHGTRLRPLTFTGNKHMLPIANQPMISYGLNDLKDAGIREIGVILGPINEGIEETFGDGHDLGVRLHYINQGPPLGLAHAVRVARDFLDDEPFLMYLGDNLLEHGCGAFVDRFAVGDASAVIGTTPTKGASRYGVVELDDQQRILSIEEKPVHPRSDLALTGVYLFTPEIHDVIDGLTPSARGELEITDAIRVLHERTHRVRVIRITGWWKDTGHPFDLLDANEKVLASWSASRFEVRGKVADSAQLSGRVAVGEGSVIGEGVTVRGPVVIGRNVVIDHAAFIGPYTAVGDGASVRRAEITRAILMENVEVDAELRIVDSIIGQGSRIGNRTRLPSGSSLIIGDSSQLLL